MIKALRPLFIFVLLLSACNMPSPTATAAPGDAVATKVSQTLTHQPDVTQVTEKTTQPAGTTPQPPSATVTVAKATTIAPTPTVPTATTTKLPPSITPTVTIPSTATLTATPIPGDPKTALGNPVWKDSFTKPSSWGLDSAYDDGHTRVSMSSGKLILKSYDANGWRGWRYTFQKVQDFYLDATINTLTCSGNDTYGLLFRSPDNFKSYWFGLTCDGKYSLHAGDINDLNELIKAKSSALIKSGSNQTNRLGVMLKGNKISLYVNGKLLEDFTNDTFTAAGTFGYFIAGSKTAGFTIESTEIAYWNLK